MKSAAIIYDFSKIKKRLNVYEKSQSEFAAKRTLTKLGKELKGSKGLIAQTYLGQHGFKPFESAVFFTLNSTFTKQSGLTLFVGVKDERAISKGNPAAKYLYPPIGGGSTKAYGTLFTQYLKDRNYMNQNDYPFAITSNRLIKVGKNNRVTKSTYSNTMIGLAKTRAKEIPAKSRKNGKIQDARVIAFKSDTSKYRKGIYREQTPSSGKYRSFLRPLFVFDSPPTQKPQSTFKMRVKRLADERVYKYWKEEIKRLAK
tara:strand:+ start:124 stop:894 length:771 start_codon:yes stop_codon:yes gene_type:complete